MDSNNNMILTNNRWSFHERRRMIRGLHASIDGLIHWSVGNPIWYPTNAHPFSWTCENAHERAVNNWNFCFNNFCTKTVKMGFGPFIRLWVSYDKDNTKCISCFTSFLFDALFGLSLDFLWLCSYLLSNAARRSLCVRQSTLGKCVRYLPSIGEKCSKSRYRWPEYIQFTKGRSSLCVRPC